jgi:hypothetical protein
MVDEVDKYPGPKEFAHLHVHTVFSPLDGIPEPEHYIRECTKRGWTAFAVTDHGSLGAIPDAYFAAKEAGIKFIPGCFLPNQPVITSNGIKNISSIIPGDSVLTHAKTISAVTDIFTRNYNGVILGIKTWGLGTIWCTPEHPFLVRKVQRYESPKGVWHESTSLGWIHASDIKREKMWRTYGTLRSKDRSNKRRYGFYLCAPRINGVGIDKIDVIHILNSSGRYSTIARDGDHLEARSCLFPYPRCPINLPPTLRLDEEFLWICGLWLAEGSIKDGLIFSLGGDERAFAERIRLYFGRLGITVNIRDRRPKRNSIDVTVYSRHLGMIYYKLFGEHFHAKQIPIDWLMNLNLIQRKALLNGLLDGGKHTPDCSVFKVNNRNLAWQTRILIWSIGQTSAISEIKNNNTPNLAYQVRYRNRGHCYYDWDDKFIYCPVNDIIQTQYSGLVYNLEVEDHHSYCVGALVHNCEFYYNDKHLELKEKLAKGITIGAIKAVDKELRDEYVRNRHITILAKNQTGYVNLISIMTEAWEIGQYYKPRTWFDRIAEHREGLIILSGCLNGPICHYLRRNNIQAALSYVRKFRDLLGDDFYIELQMPGIPDEERDGKKLDGGLRTFIKLSCIAKKLGIKTVLTNDSHYMTRNDFKIQKLMMAIEQGMTIDDPNLFHVNSDEQFFKTRAELRQTFMEGGYATIGVADIHDFERACDATLEIAEKCRGFEPDTSLKLPEIQNADQELVRLAFTNLKKKGLDQNPAYVERLKYELRMVLEKNYSSYLMITRDLLDYSRSIGYEVGPGRGSSGGSLAAYLIGITSIDPLKFKLSFERFISPSRGGKLLKVNME